MEEPAFVPKKKRGRIFGLIAIVAVILVLAAAAVAFFLMGGQKSNESIVYVNDDYELMFLENTKEKTEAVEFSDEATSSSGATLSPDGKYIYFMEFDDPEQYSWRDGTLMRIQVSELDAEGVKAEKLDSEVSMFWFLESGDLFYVKMDSDYLYEIFIHDGESKKRLAKEVNGWEVDEENNYLYYTEQDDDGAETLYRVALDGTGSKEKLLKDFDVIWSDYNAEVLLYGRYTEWDEDEENYGDDTYTVYSCTPGGEETELLEDVLSVLNCATSEEDAPRFYYMTQNLTQRTLYDFVTDTYAAADEAILEEGYPDYPDYPYYNDYDPYYLVTNGDGVYIGYETYSGNEIYFTDGFTTEDRSVAVDLALSMGDAAWDAALEEYYAAEEAWDAAVDAYYMADDRQYVREDLKSWDYLIRHCTLHKYENSESTEIADRLDLTGDFISEAEAGIFLYQKVEDKAEKVIDIADVEYAGQVSDMLESEENTVWYVNVNGAESEMEFDTRDVAVVYEVNCFADEVVFGLSDGEDGILECYTRTGSELTFRAVLSEEYDSYSAWVSEDGEALYFWEDVDGETYEGDLIRYVNGKSEPVAKGVYEYFDLACGTAYTLSEREQNDDGIYIYELRVKQGDRWVTVNDECRATLAFLDDKQVVYISDNDLYLWNGEENRRLAKDVLTFWAESVEYQRY